MDIRFQYADSVLVRKDEIEGSVKVMIVCNGVPTWIEIVFEDEVKVEFKE